ncbi:MAG: bifunctional glutamate N-acetyltransferase/amino-acid acetyltransferase ArgJ [Fibrobacterota bacterium]
MKITAEKGAVTAPKGFKASGISVGLKKSGKPDMALLCPDSPCTAAGAFTRNKIKAAPVYQAMACLSDNECGAVIVNSGNANACTGSDGMRDAETMAAVTAGAMGLSSEDVAVCSTGIIGKRLDMNKICPGIEKCVSSLSPSGGSDFAKAICTTDTITKEVKAEFMIGDKKVCIGGCAKGSGMIHPNMATMLAFITTDAVIEKETLNKIFFASLRESFNSITVDGDTSTNDTAIIMASGKAGNRAIDSHGPGYNNFVRGLNAVMINLARMIVRDGEGATKIVTIRVESAPSEEEARRAAMAVARSNLVKTALFGNDPNWGRILCALGYSGSSFDSSAVSLTICGIPVVSGSEPLDFDAEKISSLMKKKEMEIFINLNSGSHKAVVHTCDLSYDYVKINAEYHT